MSTEQAASRCYRGNRAYQSALESRNASSTHTTTSSKAAKLVTFGMSSHIHPREQRSPELPLRSSRVTHVTVSRDTWLSSRGFVVTWHLIRLLPHPKMPGVLGVGHDPGPNAEDLQHDEAVTAKASCHILHW